MKFSFFIAWRYFQPSVKKHLIHRIGLVCFMSIAVSTMSLLLVLSVFNGLEGFIWSLFRSFDPDIKITLKKGKAFTLDEDLRQQIKAVTGVSKVVDILEDKALLRYQDQQIIIQLKGVSDEFLCDSRLKPYITQGEFKLKQRAAYFAILGNGVQHALSIPLSKQFNTLQVFYPNKSDVRVLLPAQLYTCKNICPGAVFTVEKQFDAHYVIVPIDFAAILMNMKNKRTALEIQVVEGFSIDSVQKDLQRLVPNCFQVLNSTEQQATLLKAIHVERLFVFLIFSFILLVASLNIFFILSMLVLNKRKDIAVLYTLGTTPINIRFIFLMDGLLIALSGATVGMLIAWGLSWLQQTFGLVSLGVETSLVEAYPIQRKGSDFIYTFMGIVLMTCIAAYYPAQLATRTKVQMRT
mmetsp:Transcript_6418/g.14548  ORF Transcript_6418/g.14548 Transcript_6418/m.14548 type:complete len:408 (-) Transcript_6418:4287-5510(-)